MIADPDSIARLLTLRYDPKKKPVKRSLSAADFKPDPCINTSNVESQIASLIRDELEQKLVDLKFKRISLSLSGGVDSRLTLAMVRTFLPDVKISCISVGFGEEDDEVSMAQEMARNYDCDFHRLMLDNILTDLPRLISIVKEPRWNLYQYYTFDYGKRISNVFYTGDGGDELFGGYTFRYQKYLSLLPVNATWKEKARFYLSCHERDWVPDQATMFGPNIEFSWEKIYTLFKPYFSNNNLDSLDQVFLADFNGKLLYDWIPTNDAFSRHLKLKINSIFLTSKMIRFATHLPWQTKYDPKTQIGKMPLRSILSRQKGIHDAINSSKKGFSVGLGYLWNKNAHEVTSSYLDTESEIIKNKLVDSKWLKATMKNLQEGSMELNPRYINKVFSLLALEVWYRLFVSHTMKKNQKL